MTVTDLFEISFAFALLVLLIMMLVGAIGFRPARLKGVPWRDRLRRFGRYALVRLPIALACGLAVFVLGAAALTLNSHRPPADNDPALLVPPGTKTAKVTVDLEDCGQGAEGHIRISGVTGLAAGPIRLYTDGEGWRRLEPTADGRSAHARFSFDDPTQKKSLLSCYLLLPVVKGASEGYEVRVKLPELLEVDRDTSVPSPTAYKQGMWVWECERGRCPGFATVAYSLEDGTKQVIILVLASIFGALIALLVGEVLIEWARKRTRDPDRS